MQQQPYRRVYVLENSSTAPTVLSAFLVSKPAPEDYEYTIITKVPFDSKPTAELPPIDEDTEFVFVTVNPIRFMADDKVTLAIFIERQKILGKRISVKLENISILTPNYTNQLARPSFCVYTMRGFYHHSDAELMALTLHEFDKTTDLSSEVQRKYPTYEVNFYSPRYDGHKFIGLAMNFIRSKLLMALPGKVDESILDEHRRHRVAFDEYLHCFYDVNNMLIQTQQSDKNNSFGYLKDRLSQDTRYAFGLPNQGNIIDQIRVAVCMIDR